MIHDRVDGAPAWRVLALAALAGLLVTAALPPWGWWPSAFAGVAVIDHLVAEQRAWSRFRRGFLIGLALLVPTYSWMAAFTPPGYVIAVLFYSGLLGGALALLPPAAPWRWAALPGALALWDALRGRWPFGGVPISTFALGQVGSPLVGIARVGGPLLLAVAAGLAGVLLATATRAAAGAVVARGRDRQSGPSASTTIADDAQPEARAALARGTVDGDTATAAAGPAHAGSSPATHTGGGQGAPARTDGDTATAAADPAHAGGATATHAAGTQGAPARTDVSGDADEPAADPAHAGSSAVAGGQGAPARTHVSGDAGREDRREVAAATGRHKPAAGRAAWGRPVLAGDDGRRAGAAAAVAAGGLVVLLVLAAAAPRARDIGPLRVGIVQGGGEQGTTIEEVPPSVVFQRTLDASRQVPPGLDVVLWPEDVVEVNGSFPSSPQGALVADEARRLHAVLLIGAIEDAGPTRFHNAQIAFSANGEAIDRYEKVRRVPFGEYTPLRGLLEAVAGGAVRTSDAIPGADPAVLRTPVGTFGVSISWEIFFADRARAAIRQGGDVLLNPTNGASFHGSIVQSQQLASTRLRAIETDRWAMQAAPTGYSAIVSPAGEVQQRTSIGEQRILVGGVNRRAGQTWAVRYGDWPALVLSVLAIGGAWAAMRRRDGASPSSR